MNLRLAAAAALLLTCAGQAAAYDPIVLARGWALVDQAADGDCTGEVRGNGRFYVIAVRGMAPDEEGRLFLTNGDMKPMDRTVRARGDGTWQEYYIPFRFNRDGGSVQATITSPTCSIPLRFAWRPSIGWDEPAPLRPVHEIRPSG